MLIDEIICEADDVDAFLDEAQVIWAKKGNRIVKKYRCTAGHKKGRIVASPEQCAMPLDIAKSLRFKKTRATKGKKMMKKAKRIKRNNPASRIIKNLNKRKK